MKESDEMVQSNKDTGEFRVQSATLSVPEAAKYLGLSVSRAYEAFRLGGELESCAVRIGTRVLVSRARLQRVLNGNED
jgi:excisionase family DNA binding protein